MMFPNAHCQHRRKAYSTVTSRGPLEFFDWTCPDCGGHGIDTQHSVDPQVRAQLLYDAGILVTNDVLKDPHYLTRQMAGR